MFDFFLAQSAQMFDVESLWGFQEGAASLPSTSVLECVHCWRKDAGSVVAGGVGCVACAEGEAIFVVAVFCSLAGVAVRFGAPYIIKRDAEGRTARFESFCVR